MNELENLLIALYSNCLTERELFQVQVNVMKMTRRLKDKRKIEIEGVK